MRPHTRGAGAWKPSLRRRRHAQALRIRRGRRVWGGRRLGRWAGDGGGRERLDLADHGRSPLIELYLERRADLVRFFTMRLRSAAAAEDLVQDIYVRLSGIDEPAEIQNPMAYLYRLGSNLMLDRLRGERRT